MSPGTAVIVYRSRYYNQRGEITAELGSSHFRVRLETGREIVCHRSDLEQITTEKP